MNQIMHLGGDLLARLTEATLAAVDLTTMACMGSHGGPFSGFLLHSQLQR